MDDLGLTEVERRILARSVRHPARATSPHEDVFHCPELLRYCMEFLEWREFVDCSVVSRTWNATVSDTKAAEARRARKWLSSNLEFAGVEARILSQAALELRDHVPRPVQVGPQQPIWVDSVDDFGHAYSLNTLTGERIWRKPKGEEDDWEEYVDETGERCYYNKLTGASITAKEGGTNAYAEEHWSQFVDGEGKLHLYNVVTGESTVQTKDVDLKRWRRLRRMRGKAVESLRKLRSAFHSRLSSRSSARTGSARTNSSASRTMSTTRWYSSRMSSGTSSRQGCAIM